MRRDAPVRSRPPQPDCHMTTAREPALEDIAAALAITDGRTPGTVVEAFLQKPVTIQGCRMAPYTAGHDLLFCDLQHPYATGGTWDGRDVLMALFVCSHPSRDLFAMVADETFEKKFFDFIETLPSHDISDVCRQLVAHLARSRRTALPMENAHGNGKKKAEDSDGGSTSWLARALRSIFRPSTWFTKSRLRSYSH